jgi:uncharacterized protein (TIGR03382 family)
MGELQQWMRARSYGIPNSAYLVGALLGAYWLFRRPRKR